MGLVVAGCERQSDPALFPTNTTEGRSDAGETTFESSGPTSTSADEATSGSGSSSAGQASDDSSGTTGVELPPPPPAPDPLAIPGIRFVGRIASADPTGYAFAWSGTGFVAAFEGTTASVELVDGGQNEFTVVVDGVVQPKLVAQAGSATYVLASQLAAGAHQIELYRRTEPSFGTTQFVSWSTDGTPLSPPAPARRIEIIGDSITAAYGIEGTSPECNFTADTQNHYLSYGALSARAIDAELHTVAWSGKGVIYNYDQDLLNPMPVLYDRALPNNSMNRWDFSVVPDVVVINLGTNDFSTDGDPEPAVFEAAYLELLERIRSHYPEATILCTNGILLSGGDLTAARSGINNAVAAFMNAGGDRIEVFELNVPNTNPGCDYHPGLAAHQAMADVLTAQLRRVLGLP